MRQVVCFKNSMAMSLMKANLSMDKREKKYNANTCRESINWTLIYNKNNHKRGKFPYLIEATNQNPTANTFTEETLDIPFKVGNCTKMSALTTCRCDHFLHMMWKRL